jgi:hypothetical protein
LLALNERSKWSLPGTEQAHSQQEEFSALGHSTPSPVKAIAPATSTTPSVLASPRLAHAHSESSNLRHQVVHHDVPASKQVAPPPSQTPTPSSTYSELNRDADGTYEITSDNFRHSELAKASYVLESNSGEMEDGENISNWQEELDALQRSNGDVNEASTHDSEEAMQVENTANSVGDVAEGSESQRVSAESGQAGEKNDASNDDTMGLEQRPATRKTSRSLNTSRPIGSTKIDASRPSTRATCGDQNLSLDHIIY